MNEGLSDHFRIIVARYSTAGLEAMLKEAVKAVETVGTGKIESDFRPWIEAIREELAKRP